MAEIKYQLRKHSFPNCVDEALRIIENIVSTIMTSSALQLVSEIISEFIFREKTASGNTAPPMRKLEELELIYRLCVYFSNGTDPGAAGSGLKKAVFSLLFPIGDGSRSATFVKLVSMFITARSQNILNVTGVWLQQTGPMSEVALALAKNIVTDFLLLLPAAKQHLVDLPRIAPEFTTCFLCSVTKLYCDQDSLPPKLLLETITGWTKISSSICVAPFAYNQQTATPFLGLLRWCVMAPLYHNTVTEEYSQLHLALLESLLVAPSERLVSAEQLGVLISVVAEWDPPVLVSFSGTLIKKEIKIDRDSGRPITPPMEKAVNRLTQIVILLFRMGLISGNTEEMFKKMDELPANDLLENFKSFRRSSMIGPYLGHN